MAKYLHDFVLAYSHSLDVRRKKVAPETGATFIMICVNNINLE